MAVKQNSVPGALEGVLAVILGQNAIILANTLKPEVFKDGIQEIDLVVFAAAFVTFFAVLFNWIVIRHLKYKDVNYTRSNMLFDIFTAAIFGVQSQAIINGVSSGAISQNYVFALISASFMIVSVLNVLWNSVELKKLASSEEAEEILQKENLHFNNRLNYISIALLTLLAVSTALEWHLVSQFAFWSWALKWTYIIIQITLDYAKVEH